MHGIYIVPRWPQRSYDLTINARTTNLTNFRKPIRLRRTIKPTPPSAQEDLELLGARLCGIHDGSDILCHSKRNRTSTDTLSPPLLPCQPPTSHPLVPLWPVRDEHQPFRLRTRARREDLEICERNGARTRGLRCVGRDYLLNRSPPPLVCALHASQKLAGALAWGVLEPTQGVW